MSMRLSLLALALSTLLAQATAAWAQSDGVVLVTPRGFNLAFTGGPADGSTKMVKFVPDGQNVDNWRQMITVQHYLRDTGIEPSQLAAQIAAGVQAECPKAQAQSLRQQPIGGQPAIRFYVYTPECARSQPETLLVVIVKAAGVLHTVQYSWRATPPTPQEFKSAEATFDQIMLCDSKIPNCLR
jgi:hypothetical protein